MKMHRIIAAILILLFSSTATAEPPFTAEEQAEIDRFLAKHGSDVKAVDAQGNTLLYKAMQDDSSVAVFKFLVSEGADVNARNYRGDTTIHWTRSGEVAQFLVSAGADVNAKNTNNQLPIHTTLARGGNLVDVVRVLVLGGTDVNARDGAGKTPLHLAWGHDVVKFLIIMGADVNAKDYHGNTPLMPAVYKSILNVTMLVANGADIHAKNNAGETALWGGWKYKEIAQFLLAEGANVNEKDYSGRTVLHDAVLNSRTEFAKLLLSEGADANARDETDATPLHLTKNVEIAKLLVSKGADVNAKDNDGKTPLDYAKGRKNTVVIEYLTNVQASPTERFEFEEPHMGTHVRIVLYAPTSEIAEKAAKEAFDSFRALNAIMSDYDPESELSLLNESRGWIRVSDDLFTVLKAAKHYSTISDGAFDVTVGPLVRLWRRSKRQQELPSEQLVEQAKQLVGNHLWEINEKTQSVRLLKAGMQFDLGAIAKGYAVDKAFDTIQKHGITSLLVDAGGDFRLGAAPPDTQGWRIEKNNEIVFLKDTAMATSGGRFQFVVINGVRYAHIVDPKTGLGMTGLQTVSVTAPTTMEADAFATVVSLLGKERGQTLIDTLPKVSMVFVEP